MELLLYSLIEIAGNIHNLLEWRKKLAEHSVVSQRHERRSMSSLGISSMYITCCFPAVLTAQTQITKSTSLVAASAVLGGTELVHLGHTLLELLVLALLIGVSLILYQSEKMAFVSDILPYASIWAKWRPSESRSSRRHAYLALPGKVVFGLPAAVQWDEKVCT